MDENNGAGGMIGQQRPTFDDIELARHLNLLKIQHVCLKHNKIA